MAKSAIKSRNRRASKRSLPALDWIEDVSGHCARATAVGSRSLLVENHTAILAFSPERIEIGTRSGTICVTGLDLSLCDVRPGALIVRGNIHRVDLPCKGGESPDEG